MGERHGQENKKGMFRESWIYGQGNTKPPTEKRTIHLSITKGGKIKTSINRQRDKKKEANGKLFSLLFRNSSFMFWFFAASVWWWCLQCQSEGRSQLLNYWWRGWEGGGGKTGPWSHLQPGLNMIHRSPATRASAIIGRLLYPPWGTVVEGGGFNHQQKLLPALPGENSF
jgi:hypothetical protein